MVSKRNRGDLFDPDCPTRTVMEAIGDKWTGIVILLLDERPLRFNELARTASGISFKMLTQTLRRLERDGFLSRTVTPSRPPAVTYALTTLGRNVVPVLDALRDWSELHVGAITKSRVIFDRDAA